VDIEVGDVTIPEGSIVHLLNAAANHDPEAFPLPHAINLERNNGRNHMAFGFGIHHCIGSGLARAELAIAIREITWHSIDGDGAGLNSIFFTSQQGEPGPWHNLKIK
jgi:cytochrome P450